MSCNEASESSEIWQLWDISNEGSILKSFENHYEVNPQNPIFNTFHYFIAELVMSATVQWNHHITYML